MIFEKNAKIALFATLIAMVAVPASGMPPAEGEANTGDTQTMTAYEELLLKNGLGVKDLPDNEKTEYISKLREFIDSKDGFEAKMFEKIDEFADAHKLLEDAKEQNQSDEEIEKLQKDAMRLKFELEDFGVVEYDRLKANPEYWAERTAKNKAIIEGTAPQNTGWADGSPDVHLVHQTDLALKRTAWVNYPCIPLDFGPLYCVQIGWGWNQGTTTSPKGFVMYNGDVDFHNSVCLDQSTHHSSVDIRMDVTRNVKHFLIGGEQQSKNTYYPNFDEKGDCHVSNTDRFLEFGYYVWGTTKISNIDLN